jgi:hypothetical protein
VGEIDDALAFYGEHLPADRGRSRSMAFIDTAISSSRSSGRSQPADEHRHFGLVVDSMDATRCGARGRGRGDPRGRGLNFRDPGEPDPGAVRRVQFSDAAVCAASGSTRKAILRSRSCARKRIEPGD